MFLGLVASTRLIAPLPHPKKPYNRTAQPEPTSAEQSWAHGRDKDKWDTVWKAGVLLSDPNLMGTTY